MLAVHDINKISDYQEGKFTGYVDVRIYDKGGLSAELTFEPPLTFERPFTF